MPRHRQIIWMSLSTVAVVLTTVSMVMAGQDPAQQAGNSAAQDPFDAAEKAGSGSSAKDLVGAAGKSPEATEKAGEKKSEKKAEPEPEFVRKSLLEWQRILPRGVFEVTRLKAT